MPTKATAKKKPVAAKKNTNTKPVAAKPQTKSSAKPAPKTISKPAAKPAKKVTVNKVVAKPTAKKKVAPVPKGYNNITPYLIVSNAVKALDFYQKAFGAKIAMRMDKPGGKIGHAELRFGDTKIMLADEFPDMGAVAPKASSTKPMSIHLYTKNVEATLKAATSAGAKVVRPLEDTFYGDRCCAIDDPFGHRWFLATHVQDVSMATIKKRAAEMFGMKK